MRACKRACLHVCVRARLQSMFVRSNTSAVSFKRSAHALHVVSDPAARVLCALLFLHEAFISLICECVSPGAYREMVEIVYDDVVGEFSSRSASRPPSSGRGSGGGHN